jgi:hypothetical protein
MIMVRYQLVIDCADPDRMARFWAAALHYDFVPAPAGFETWDDYYRHLGLPEESLDLGEDRIQDPDGQGPRIWFQKVPEAKTIKNRFHFDIAASSGPEVPPESRRARFDAETKRLLALGATMLSPLGEPEGEHYALAMADPEGNEFDVTSFDVNIT